MSADTVLLHGPEDENEVVKEGEADATITPGEVLDLTGLGTGGAADQRRFQLNSTDGVRARYVALEQSYAGRGIDDDYSDGDALVYAVLAPGMEIRTFVFDGASAGGTAPDVSSNANISPGDFLVAYSGGGDNGTLRKYDSANDSHGDIVAVATEAVDNSGGTSPARINAEVV